MTVRELKRPKMSLSMQGKKNRLGKLMSEEAKTKRKEKMGKKIESPRRIAILDVETGVTYPSITHAANELGLNISSITRALKHDLVMRSGKKFVKVKEKYPVGF